MRSPWLTNVWRISSRPAKSYQGSGSFNILMNRAIWWPSPLPMSTPICVRRLALTLQPRISAPGAAHLAAACSTSVALPAANSDVKKQSVAVVKQVAQALGNTPTVCRQHYIHPAVFVAYEQNQLPDFYCHADEECVQLPHNLDELAVFWACCRMQQLASGAQRGEQTAIVARFAILRQATHDIDLTF